MNESHLIKLKFQFMRYLKPITTIMLLFVVLNSFSQKQKCKACEGDGRFRSWVTCPNCKNWNSEYRRKVACHNCQDTREVVKLISCPFCGGDGIIIAKTGNWQFKEAQIIESPCKVIDKDGNNLSINAPPYINLDIAIDKPLFHNNGQILGYVRHTDDLRKRFENVNDFDGNYAYFPSSVSTMNEIEEKGYHDNTGKYAPSAFLNDWYDKPWTVNYIYDFKSQTLTLSQNTPGCALKALAIGLMLAQKN